MVPELKKFLVAASLSLGLQYGPQDPAALIAQCKLRTSEICRHHFPSLDVFKRDESHFMLPIERLIFAGVFTWSAGLSQGPAKQANRVVS